MGWATALTAVHLLATWAMMLKDCWMDFRNVTAVWVKAWMATVCEDIRAAVHCLAVWESSCRGWDRLLVTVHCLTACASTPRDSWADLKKLPAD